LTPENQAIVDVLREHGPELTAPEVLAKLQADGKFSELTKDSVKNRIKNQKLREK